MILISNRILSIELQISLIELNGSQDESVPHFVKSLVSLLKNLGQSRI